MIKNKRTRKTIAVFFLLNFLSSLMPYSALYANNNGPNAPEAAAFEPVDATDMVSLLTGDFTYVLPLLNVPSPEGGYPLALSYHAGIAMDQEASWIGLGWNLNPGSINRNVNGYPDDWHTANVKDVFYDVGGEETNYDVSVSFGVSDTSSLALNLSWGSNKSLSGDISYSFLTKSKLSRLTIGTAGIGIRGSGVGLNIGFNGSSSFAFSTPLSGKSAESLNFKIGVNGEGDLYGGASLSFGGVLDDPNTDQNESSSNINSVGISFTSNSISMSANVLGFGTSFSHSFNDTSTSGTYSSSSDLLNIPIITPWVGVTFTKTTHRWWADDTVNNTVSGVLYDKDYTNYKRVYEGTSGNKSRKNHLFKWDNYVLFTDDVSSISKKDLNTTYNQAVFSSKDTYIVNSQGMNGNFSPVIFNRGISSFNSLFYPDEDDRRRNGILAFDITQKKIANKIEFEFMGEYSSFLKVLPSKFVKNFNSVKGAFSGFDESEYISGIEQEEDVLPSNFRLTPNNDMVYYEGEGQASFDVNKLRLKKANNIEYFTNKQIRNDSINGFIEAKNYDRTKKIHEYHNRYMYPDYGIGAYKITASDGKTYHYSLPVYQFESIKRSYNIVEGKGENDAYFDKIRETPYATHWLLTAVTGPDYVDSNNNGVLDNKDYGYWVEFDYGKWSNGLLWKVPYGKYNDEISEKDKIVKNYEWGRKEVYYLDAVRSRTHTAFFIKDIRKDAKGRSVQYQNKSHKQHSAAVKVNVPETSGLKLNRIALFKNDDIENVTKSNIFGDLQEARKSYVYDISWHKFDGHNGNQKSGVASSYYRRFITVHQQQNVIDIGDFNNDILSKAIKTIEFNHDYTLANGVPYSSAGGRLTLESVTIKGKNNISLIPPYSFKYITNARGKTNNFSIEDKDEWGFVNEAPMLWSLNKITTPLGASIEIFYDDDEGVAAIDSKIEFTTSNHDFKLQHSGTSNLKIFSKIAGLIKEGDQVLIEFDHTYLNTDNIEQQHTKTKRKKILAKIVGKEGEQYVLGDYTFPRGTISIVSCELDVTGNRKGGGVRTTKIKVVDNKKTISKEYSYDLEGVSSGITSFRPGSDGIIRKIPYISELPSPNVYYNHVEVKEIDYNNKLITKSKYKFETFSKKEIDEIRFGKFLTIEKSDVYTTNKTKAEKVVIRDYKSRIGSLNSLERYNSLNQLLSKVKYNYRDPSDFQQSFFQESYYSARGVDFYNVGVKFFLSTSVRKIYQNVVESVESTFGGVKTISYFDKYDFLTGRVLETRTYGSDGVAYRSKIVPAYHKYSKMGSKVDNINNKNMLSQTAGEYSYILKNNTWKEVGAGITTWKSDWAYQFNDRTSGSTNDVWRKHKTYVWNGGVDDEGMYTNFTDFNFAKEASNTKWKKTSEVTKYNQFSQPLETKDVNGSYVSSKMGDNYSKVIATANANYNEMHYSGAEYVEGNYFDGGIKSLGHKPTTDAHTGDRIVQIDRGQHAFEVVVPSRATRKPIENRFKVSVWVKKGQENRVKIKLNADTHNFTMAEKVIAGNWVMLTGYITLPSNENNLPSNVNNTVAITSTNGIVQLDDFRLHPAVSSMTSYVYNKWDEVSYIIGANGLATKYIYDDAGRLKETWVEVVDNPAAGIKGGFKRVTTHGYNYKRNN